ncbi:MAG: phosphotransferase [Clostridia bacterium]|nr:phosphotransferase [Clostridia bacterium]
MRYVNGNSVLPQDLIKEIRKYVEGLYVYIPKGEDKSRKTNTETNFHKEVKIRNSRIYDQFLSGKPVEEIALQNYLSEKSIRRIILIKKREMEPVMEFMKRLCDIWGVQGEIKQLTQTTWAIGSLYVIKIYEDKTALVRNVEMLKILHQEEVPVPEIVPVKDMDYYEDQNRFYLMTTHLKGKGINEIDSLNDKWFYTFGEILAKLHQAFLVCQETMSYWNNSLLEEMKGWVSDQLTHIESFEVKKDEVHDTTKRLEKYYHLLPKQLIHRDVHLGNFIFENQTFSGYIDFDLSQSNIRIFDICYFLLGLLCEGNYYQLHEDRWFKITNEVIKGYHALMPLSGSEIKAMKPVMESIELLFGAYFLSMGDEKMAEDAFKLYKFIYKKEQIFNADILLEDNKTTSN